jgi:hypothetical protein
MAMNNGFIHSMTPEKKKRKVADLLTQADSNRPPTEEATRQMIQNLAGFFSQIAAWDTRQTSEARAA